MHFLPVEKKMFTCWQQKSLHSTNKTISDIFLSYVYWYISSKTCLIFIDIWQLMQKVGHLRPSWFHLCIRWVVRVSTHLTWKWDNWIILGCLQSQKNAETKTLISIEFIMKFVWEKKTLRLFFYNIDIRYTSLFFNSSLSWLCTYTKYRKTIKCTSISVLENEINIIESKIDFNSWNVKAMISLVLYRPFETFFSSFVEQFDNICI